MLCEKFTIYRPFRVTSQCLLCFKTASLEGLTCIFRGAYIQREIYLSKSISLIDGRKFTVFALFYLVFVANFPSASSHGSYMYIQRGDFMEGFLRYPFGRLIFGRAYTWRGLFSECYSILTILQWSLKITTFFSKLNQEKFSLFFGLGYMSRNIWILQQNKHTTHKHQLFIHAHVQ